MSPDANQDADESLHDADVHDLTERRKLERVREMADDLQHMVVKATRELIPQPTELGDLEGVSPTGWSRARNSADDNYMWKAIAAMIERDSEGADPDVQLQYALLPLAVFQMLRAAHGEKVDVPEAVQEAVDQMAEANRLVTRAIMDGVLEEDERRLLRDVFRAVEVAARQGRTSMGQSPGQVELWPSPVNGPRF